MFAQWDPGRSTFYFMGIQAIGFMDGTFITAERAEDAFTEQVGAAGDVTRVRNRNKTGTVTVVLQAASPTNALWSALAIQDEQFGLGVGSLLAKNTDYSIAIDSPRGWIKKIPKLEMAAEAVGREWVFTCANLHMDIGSAILIG